MSQRFYLWPCGMFEELGGPWTVMCYRPMPATPAGDVVFRSDNKQACVDAVYHLNEINATLEQALAIYGTKP